VRCRKQRLAGDSQEVIRDPAMKLAGGPAADRGVHRLANQVVPEGQRPRGLGDQATEYDVTEQFRCQLGLEYGEVVDRQRSPDDLTRVGRTQSCWVRLTELPSGSVM
jgi:hypothetical protein